MTNKHTPGRWSVIEEKDPVVISSWHIKVGASKWGFFPYKWLESPSNPGMGGYVSDDEAMANARLISAAPELLEALEELSKRFESCKQAGLSASDAYDSFYQEMTRAAIAKAIGGSDDPH